MARGGEWLDRIRRHCAQGVKGLRPTAGEEESMTHGLSRRRGPLAVIAIVAASLATIASSAAQSKWPERPITIIVPFPPAGWTDILSRMVAAEVGPALGQAIVVENRGGANGNVGLAAAARAAPDGYTFVIVSGVFLVNPHISKVAYDPEKDFTPVAYLGASPNVLVTSPASGIASVQDLIAKAKASPGRYNYATSGIGSMSQLAVELLKIRTGIEMVHVPYSGAAPAAQAALAGTTEIASLNIAGQMGPIQSGALKALVQTGEEPWPDLPTVPTMAQAGIPNAEVETAFMLLAPAGTPADIVDRLAREVEKMMTKPELQGRMRAGSFAPKFEGPAEAKARVARQAPIWKDIVERAGIKKN
jgi:tripartite-type tricarboxylate transporter receptor subunit TctC